MTMYYISRIFQIIAKHKKEVILILLLSVICLFLTGKMYDMQHVSAESTKKYQEQYMCLTFIRVNIGQHKNEPVTIT